MLPESVESTEIEPNDRSQPQISAIFPYLGTRFPKKDGIQHGKTCKTQKGQSPTRESMPSQKGQGLTQQDKRPRKRPVLNPRRHTSFRKNPIELKRCIRPEKGDARSRKHAIKKRCTIHHTNRKMGDGWHRCLYKRHILCSTGPILEKSAMTAP